LKQTSKAAFTPAAMTAEEIAVIVPIADAVIEDDEMELWTVLRPALVQGGLKWSSRHPDIVPVTSSDG